MFRDEDFLITDSIYIQVQAIPSIKHMKPVLNNQFLHFIIQIPIFLILNS